MMSSSKMQVSFWTFKANWSVKAECMLCSNTISTELTTSLLCVWTLLISQTCLTYFCFRYANRELVPHVVSFPSNNHHRSIHLLCHIAGASDNGKPQSIWPQRSSHSVQLQRGGSLTLHVLWSESTCLCTADKNFVLLKSQMNSKHHFVLLSSLWGTEPWHMPMTALWHSLFEPFFSSYTWC